MTSYLFSKEDKRKGRQHSKNNFCFQMCTDLFPATGVRIESVPLAGTELLPA